MNLAVLLARIAKSEPERPAIFRGTTLHATYAQWAQRAARFAARLAAQGLAPGERVVLFSKNHPRYLDVLLGLWWGGYVAVPVNAKLHPRELEWIIGNARAARLVRSADALPNEEVRAGAFAGCPVLDIDGHELDAWLGEDAPLAPIVPRAPDDTAWLFYTSGTTGRPKGVMITHRNLLAMGLGYFADVDAVSREDAICYAAPMSHGAGLYLVPHLIAAARHVVPASGGVDPAEMFALGKALGPLSTFAAPTIVNRLVDHAAAAGLSTQDAARSFKTIVYGGAPMYAADIARALAVMGPRFVQIYGQGESPMTGTVLSRHHLADTAHPRYAARLASVGLPQTPVQIRVADPGGRPLPPGEVGEVLISGDSVMAGYFDNPDATRAAIRDGWLWTGDMGALDEDGFLTLKDRSKDLIISGGSNIYPREVEEVLLCAPGVAEVAVVGARDAEWGEVVVAFVVPQEGARLDPATLDAYCLEHIARFKRPKSYRLVEALPKNNYGKVLKTELRARLAAEEAAASGTDPRAAHG